MALKQLFLLSKAMKHPGSRAELEVRWETLGAVCYVLCSYVLSQKTAVSCVLSVIPTGEPLKELSIIMIRFLLFSGEIMLS